MTKHRWEVPQQRVVWDTPFAKWADGDDWVPKLQRRNTSQHDLVGGLLKQVGGPAGDRAHKMGPMECPEGMETSGIGKLWK